MSHKFNVKEKNIFYLLIVIICSGCAATTQKIQRPEPSWIRKTIIPKGEFIYSIGHSTPRKTEKEARDEALASATEEFVKYCKVDVQSFDRSVEVYSKEDGRDFFSKDIRAQRFIRARAFVTRAIPEDWYVRVQGRRYIASVFLKIPKEEFDRIVNEKDIRLSLDILFYYEDETGRMQPLSDGNVLTSGDGYAIYLNPSDNCYVYVYQVDALGKTFRLFPNPEFHTGFNPLFPGDGIWLPNTRELFELDETTGKERFYIFASPDRIAEFERKGSMTLEKEDLDRVIEIKKMGVAWVREKRDVEKLVLPKHKMPVAEVKKKLQAEGAFAYETWFWHK